MVVTVVPEELKLTATLPLFFAGGGAVGDVVLGGDVREAGRCGRDVGVAIISLVWVLVELEAGFPR